MRTMLACLSAVVLGLATGLSVSAQTDDNAAARRQAENQQTIRGVIAGISVVGEMAIDYRTNRAAAAEASFITVVGSPRGGAMRGMGSPADRNETRREGAGQDQADRGEGRDANRAERDQADRGEGRDADRADNQDAQRRRRDNLYVLSITPRTQVFEAAPQGRPQGGENRSRPAAARDSDRDEAGQASPRQRNRDNENQPRDRDEANRAADRDDQSPARDRDQVRRDLEQGPRGASPSSFEALEIGDRVAVTFVSRSDAASTGREAQGGANRDQQPNEMNRRHGRNRVFFGEAVTIIILPGPPQQAMGSDRGPSARDGEARYRAGETQNRERAGATRENTGRDRDRQNDQDQRP